MPSRLPTTLKLLSNKSNPKFKFERGNLKSEVCSSFVNYLLANIAL